MGWTVASLEISPFWLTTRMRTVAAARDLHRRGGKANLFIKIPGTSEGLPAIEAAIFAGVPVNVTLLFSREQYVAAADAYLRGVERRIATGLNPAVASVASLFVSRWDVAVAGKVPAEFTNRLGIAVAQRAYKAYLELLASARFQRAANVGARAQRLLRRALARKTQRRPTRFTSRRSPHPSRSIPCRRAPRLSPITGSRRHTGTRRRRLREGSGQFRLGGYRHRCARSTAPGGGRLVLRQVLERSDGLRRF